MKVQGDKLVVAAPQQFQKPTKNMVPKVVKEKLALAQAPVERGWEVGDHKARTELKEKMKKEDPKSVPPPTVQASEKAGTSPATNASPAASVAPANAATPSASPTKDRGKNKNNRNDKVSPLATPSASVPPVTGPATTR